jgi:hypothetical protein
VASANASSLNGVVMLQPLAPLSRQARAASAKPSSGASIRL